MPVLLVVSGPSLSHSNGVHLWAGNAELYLSWLDGETFETVTAPRYGSFHPWPLGGVLTWLRRRKMAARLQALQWADKTLDAVYAEVSGCHVLPGAMFPLRGIQTPCLSRR